MTFKNLIDDNFISVKNPKFNITLYGDIYNFQEVLTYLASFLTIEELKKKLFNISGYFLILIEDNSSYYLITDVFANYRVYNIVDNNGDFIISNNYFDLYSIIPDKSKNSNEEIYFQRHRYTTGFNTLHTKINKLYPASITKIDKNNSNSSNIEIYYRLENELPIPSEEYKLKNYQYIRGNIINNIDRKKPVFLFFSGGVDSTYLALVLKKENIDFRAIFIEYYPADNDNIVDKNKSIAVTKELDIKLEILKLDIRNFADKYQDIAMQQHPIDKAFSISLYYACDVLKQQYGKCTIINGQSSDSIYCWSASSKTLGGLFQRYLTNSNYISTIFIEKYIASNLIYLAYKYKWDIKYNYAIPTKYDKYLIGVLDPQGYLPVYMLDKKYEKYNQYLSSISNFINKQVKNIDYILLYMKFMYLQGTSNIPVVKSANYYGHKMIMPFLDIRIVSLKILKQNEFKNTIKPRYVLEEFLKDSGFNIKIIDKAKKVKLSDENKKKIKEFDTLVENIYSNWEDKFEKIYK